MYKVILYEEETGPYQELANSLNVAKNKSTKLLLLP